MLTLHPCCCAKWQLLARASGLQLGGIAHCRRVRIECDAVAVCNSKLSFPIILMHGKDVFRRSVRCFAVFCFTTLPFHVSLQLSCIQEDVYQKTSSPLSDSTRYADRLPGENLKPASRTFHLR